MPRCDRWYLFFISCLWNDFRYWNSVTLWVQRSDGYSALGCCDSYQQIPIMIKMLMIALPSVGDGLRQHPLILPAAGRAPLICNRLGWNTSCVVAWHRGNEWWPHCMDCFTVVFCDVEWSVLKGGRGCWANQRNKVSRCAIRLANCYCIQNWVMSEKNSTEDHTLKNLSMSSCAFVVSPSQTKRMYE